MSNKLYNIVLLSFLIMFAHPINTISMKSKAITREQPFRRTRQFSVQDTISKCMSAFMGAFPPDFCWKKGADFGVIPTGCPAGYFRSLALCYEHCAPGYRHVLGVRWADCGSGYADHGLSCFKHIFSWYFKHSYIPG